MPTLTAPPEAVWESRLILSDSRGHRHVIEHPSTGKMAASSIMRARSSSRLDVELGALSTCTCSERLSHEPSSQLARPERRNGVFCTKEPKVWPAE